MLAQQKGQGSTNVSAKLQKALKDMPIDIKLERYKAQFDQQKKDALSRAVPPTMPTSATCPAWPKLPQWR